MTDLGELIPLIEVLKLHRFYRGSFRTRMDSMIYDNYLTEGNIGYVFDLRPSPQSHPGLILGKREDFDTWAPPEKMWSLQITREMAQELKPERLITNDDSGYGDIWHPYISSMDNAKLTFCCVNCREPLEKSLELGPEIPDPNGHLECIWCGWLCDREEVIKEMDRTKRFTAGLFKKAYQVGDIATSHEVMPDYRSHHTEEDFYEGDLVDRIEAYNSYVLEYVPLSKIDLEEWEVQEDLVEDYTKMVGEGSEPPVPILDGNYGIIDGTHRLNALARAGRTEALCWVGKWRQEY